jgi:hypothetical protein
MSNPYENTERGQNLVIFAILTLVFIALAGLVIDGGFSLAKRRQAQNAADAGALAGANMLCATNPIRSPYDAAWDYSVTRNGATDANISIDQNLKTVTVQAIVPHDTFLARILGSDIVTTTATATAGCSFPCEGTGVLPVAWACKDPTFGGEEQDTCAIQYGTVDTPGPYYIIMDSNKAEEDYQCQDPVTHLPEDYLDCDLDDTYPYENDLMVGGGRSWLDLNGGSSGSSELVDWIKSGYDDVITEHMWLPGTDGTAADIFGAASLRTGDLVILPVFNDYTIACRPDTDAACLSQWHSQDLINPSSGTSTDYYHIISFSVFKITCVSKVPGQHCPVKDYLVSNDIIDHQVKTIEGYFVEGYVPGLSGNCSYDSGAYTIYLK